jgi:hypothetical protein
MHPARARPLVGIRIRRTATDSGIGTVNVGQTGFTLAQKSPQCSQLPPSNQAEARTMSQRHPPSRIEIDRQELDRSIEIREEEIREDLLYPADRR